MIKFLYNWFFIQKNTYGFFYSYIVSCGCHEEVRNFVFKAKDDTYGALLESQRYCYLLPHFAHIPLTMYSVSCAMKPSGISTTWMEYSILKKIFLCHLPSTLFLVILETTRRCVLLCMWMAYQYQVTYISVSFYMM